MKEKHVRYTATVYVWWKPYVTLFWNDDQKALKKHACRLKKELTRQGEKVTEIEYGKGIW